MCSLIMTTLCMSEIKVQMTHMESNMVKRDHESGMAEIIASRKQKNANAGWVKSEISEAH